MDLPTFLTHLDSVHGRTRRLVDVIPPDQIDWRPAAGRWSFGDLIRHLAGIERYMYGETVHGRPSRYPGHDPALGRSYHEARAYYDRLHDESRALFAALPADRMTEKCLTPAVPPIGVWKWPRPHWKQGPPPRAPFSLMFGTRGFPPPPIYGLTSEEVQALTPP